MMVNQPSVSKLYGGVLRHWPLLHDTEASEPDWLNLGYWEPGTTSYREAGRALARRLAQSADLASGEEVLEVGSGYGEAAMLWVEDRLQAEGTAPRVRGLNITPEHVELANQRLRQRPSCEPYVSFAVGDAVSAALGEGRFDKVIALECAFHFRTRARFLENAYKMLKPGGTLAVTDLVLFPATAQRIQRIRRVFPPRIFESILRRVTDFLDQPMENLCTAQEYRQLLGEVGFHNIRIETLYARSTVPFIAYCRRRLRTIARQQIPDTLAFRWLMQLYLLLLPTSDYLLIVASKPTD